jgi:hypothetical protein
VNVTSSAARRMKTLRSAISSRCGAQEAASSLTVDHLLASHGDACAVAVTADDRR